MKRKLLLLTLLILSLTGCQHAKEVETTTEEIVTTIEETTTTIETIEIIEIIETTEEKVIEIVEIIEIEEETIGNFYLGKYKLTAYCPCYECNGQWTGQPTASGTDYVAGRTVACNNLPLGTHVLINGHEYIVEDTGAMGDYIIDIYFDTHAETERFGVQWADVFRID